MIRCRCRPVLTGVITRGNQLWWERKVDEDSNTPPDQAPGSTRRNVKTRWDYVRKRGWSPADFSKVLEKWLRVGINLAYRQEFMRFLKGKYKYDFTGDSRGPT